MTNLKISGGSSEKYILNPFLNIFSGMAQVHSEKCTLSTFPIIMPK